MNKWIKLIPYWFLLFTIGFGWFILAPIVPNLIGYLHTNLSGVLVIISSYGYTMAIFGLLAGYLSAKFSVRLVLYIAMVISIIGLLGRALSTGYLSFFIFGITAAIAYPLAVAPIGSISESVDKDKSNTITGISLGVLFLGLSFGALVGPHIVFLGLRTLLLIPVILSIVAAVILPFAINQFPKNYTRKSLHGTFKIGMIKNWWVGLAIASMSVMLGSIATTVLNLHNLANAATYGGILGGLAFLGAALGSIVLPSLFEKIGKIRFGLVFSSVLSFIFVSTLLFSLSYSTDLLIMETGFFFFGFFGNSYWVMALASVTKYVSNPAQAGFATSMYSVFTNVGVSLVPVFLGVEFGSFSTIAIGIIVVLIVELIATVFSPFLKETFA
jgi:MFS family permease